MREPKKNITVVYLGILPHIVNLQQEITASGLFI